MRLRELTEGVGRITKQNQTSDVGPNEIKTQAAKFGNKVDKDGRPPTLSKKVKGSSTNVAFNLGLTESYKLQLERDREMLVLNITDTKTGKRTEVRGKSGYESGNYDPNDKLHILLDKVGKSANISELINGEVVTINPKHPDGDNAKAATNVAFNECPRTKAASCQCESVNTVTETQEDITAMCTLEQSDTVKGTILFKQQGNGPTLIVGEITGLEPGEHGFHIHEFGDLSKGCESAGGHYNPDGVDHGDLKEGHVGDLGNITADDNGVAKISIVAERIDLTGERSIVGRSVVVHADQDDLGKGGDEESLKTGNAGDRLACGVILLKETVNENFAEDKEIGIHRSSEDFAVIDLSKSADGTFWLNGVDNTDWDSTVTTGQGVDMAFEISPQAKLASYDDIDKYSIDELENMGYDGVRMVDGDNIAYQIWNTKILKRTKLGENFADGKKKGKSRPGRFKKAGVSCKGSVTSLRKKAKNTSGEKQKGYHWCANMKSGRKKK